MQSVFRITVTAGLVGLLMMLSPAQSAIAGAPVPSPVIATNSPVTVGSPSTLLVTNIGFSTYTLNCLAVGATLSFSSGTLTSGGSIASQITAASPGTGVVSCVLIDSNGNTSTPGTTKITFLPAPLPPVITVPSSVAAGSKNVYASVLAPPQGRTLTGQYPTAQSRVWAPWRVISRGRTISSSSTLVAPAVLFSIVSRRTPQAQCRVQAQRR